jgi:hypothetical protein
MRVVAGLRPEGEEPTGLGRRLSGMTGPRMPMAPLLVALCMTACSPGGDGGASQGPPAATSSGSSSSCAGVIEVGGITYIPAGRGGSPVPETGSVLRGRALPCDDGGSPVAEYPVTAHTVPGVETADAVAADGYQLMLAERLWEVPRAQLTQALQSYLSR